MKKNPKQIKHVFLLFHVNNSFIHSIVSIQTEHVEYGLIDHMSLVI